MLNTFPQTRTINCPKNETWELRKSEKIKQQRLKTNTTKYLKIADLFYLSSKGKAIPEPQQGKSTEERGSETKKGLTRGKCCY